ncbi:Gfo/Idh/MocA family protein [Paenibacillus mendelii]|uniref:Gfo/Idh/MocA family protein n=1 Tax=Paenibacillus mendelii TaxID=206163 RepID=A0ABV6JIT0_9BACL|nr:Gfo/Idh/MocA family oxidoreductase [Paenibacillus mendelii]MCQ6558754.1 Gfo/Idh/MocA family oxidoreductase [Paenibacillus mendelii]
MSNVKIGVIGLGTISGLHLSSYAKNPHVELRAVCDVNPERAKQVADQNQVEQYYTDYRELLSDPEIDGVSICTWNDTHAEIAIAALNAGKHVLIEKPLCKTVEEALRIGESVRQSGKIFQMGFVRRFDENAQTAKQFVDNGDLGEIYYAKASCLRRLGNPGGWFADINRSGGGPLIDVGVHIIDLCWYLMGKPKVKSVNGAVHHKLGNRRNVKGLDFYKAADYDTQLPNTIEDLAVALIRFENGSSLQVDASFTLHAKKDEVCLKLFGDKGGMEIDPEFMIVSEKYDTIVNLQPQVNKPHIDVYSAFQNEIDHFIDCIQTGNTPISTVEDGIEIMKILCAIYESGQQQREIVFDS